MKTISLTADQARELQALIRSFADDLGILELEDDDLERVLLLEQIDDKINAAN